MIDGVVGRGDLLQGLALVTLLAARGPVRWSAQAFGPRRPRRLLEPVARRWLAAVGTIQSEPALKFRKTRFQSRDLGRLGRHQRNQLFLRRPAARIRIIHRILESKPDSAVEENLPPQPPTQPINLGSYDISHIYFPPFSRAPLPRFMPETLPSKALGLVNGFMHLAN